MFLDRQDNTESCLDFPQAMSDLSRQVFNMTAEKANHELLAIKVKCVDVMSQLNVVLANADMAFDDFMSLACVSEKRVLFHFARRTTNKPPHRHASEFC